MLGVLYIFVSTLRTLVEIFFVLFVFLLDFDAKKKKNMHQKLAF